MTKTELAIHKLRGRCALHIFSMRYTLVTLANKHDKKHESRRKAHQIFPRCARTHFANIAARKISRLSKSSLASTPICSFLNLHTFSPRRHAPEIYGCNRENWHAPAISVFSGNARPKYYSTNGIRGRIIRRTRFGNVLIRNGNKRCAISVLFN